MIYMFCANGTEEVEALATLDTLRRAGLNVTTVGLNGASVEGPHNICFVTDMTLAQFKSSPRKADAVILPGGGPGTLALKRCGDVCDFVLKIHKSGGIVAAICAAPSVLGSLGILKEKKATCFPGFEDQLDGAEYTGLGVTRDGNIITAKGVGCSFDFALEIVAALKGRESADKLAASMMYSR